MALGKHNPNAKIAAARKAEVERTRMAAPVMQPSFPAEAGFCAVGGARAYYKAGGAKIL
jgi:hypothetical protein